MQLREIKNGRLAMVSPMLHCSVPERLCTCTTLSPRACAWLIRCVAHLQVAFVGFAVQALVTREQPIAGLQAHLADHFGHNIITNIGKLQDVATYYGTS